MQKLHLWFVVVLLLPHPVTAISPPNSSDTTPYRDWIINMKLAERGTNESNSAINKIVLKVN